MSTSTAIIINDLTKDYKGFKLHIPFLELHYGKVYGLYGENGSGKTTLLKLIASIIKHDEGTITFNPASKKTPPEITFLFQEPKLLNRTVKNNLIYPLKIKKIPFTEQTLKNVLQIVGMDFDKFSEKKPHELSGGEKKRISLAQKIIFDPDIVILDEPTANVDVKSIQVISELIVNFKKSNKLVLISNHDYNWLSNTCDDIIPLKDGKLEPVKL